MTKNVPARRVDAPERLVERLTRAVLDIAGEVPASEEHKSRSPEQRARAIASSAANRAALKNLTAAMKEKPLALVGAGLSVAAGLPSWNALLTEMEHQLEDLDLQYRYALRDADALWRAEEYRYYLGEKAYQKLIKDRFGAPVTMKPDSVAVQLVKLPFRHFMTTNYDDVLTTAHKVARLRVPEVAVPKELEPTISRMATIAEVMVGRVEHIIADRDVEAARELEEADEEMDRLRRSSFRELLGADWAHGVEPAIDIALLGRYYERIADHAVSIARRVVFLVTGEQPAYLNS